MPTVKYMVSRQSRGVARSLSIFFISVVIGLSACQSQEIETRSQAPVRDKSITTSSAPREFDEIKRIEIHA